MIVGRPGPVKRRRRINCIAVRPALPIILSACAAAGDDEAQIERLLFGYEEDGHIEPGLFEQAHGGTLYLDEVCHFPQAQQKAILKMLIDGITRQGGAQAVPIDARILSSCSENVETRIADGFLRKDPYHRLNVMTLDVPGLKQRRHYSIFGQLFHVCWPSR